MKAAKEILLEIDPVDFAGAVAHVAAAKLYQILTESEDENWIGCEMQAKDDTNLPQAVDFLARYVAERNPALGQLARYAEMSDVMASGAIINPARLMAFDTFTRIARAEFNRLSDLQAEMAYVAPPPAQPIALEDSIFEPHGSLGDQEPHQKQFLADLARVKSFVEEQEAVVSSGLSIGGSTVATLQAAAGILNSINLGSREEAHEEEATATGPQAVDSASPAEEGADAFRDGAGVSVAGAGVATGAKISAADGENGAPETLPGADSAAKQAGGMKKAKQP